jgi:hypothetical protein
VLYYVEELNTTIHSFKNLTVLFYHIHSFIHSHANATYVAVLMPGPFLGFASPTLFFLFQILLSFLIISSFYKRKIYILKYKIFYRFLDVFIALFKKNYYPFYHQFSLKCEKLTLNTF